MKMTLNKERINLLLVALRSGEYKQGTERLKTETAEGDKLCCMGVACEVFLKEAGKGYWKRSDDPMFDGSYAVWFNPNTPGYGNEVGVMPSPVADWFGFDSVNPWLLECSLSLRNDNLGQTFLEIADAIEEAYITSV
jgi:hypothetical protein